MNYAAGIKRARLRAKLSQGELARQSGVTASYISRLEAGRRVPSLGVLDVIARACGCVGLEIFEWSRAAKKPQREPKS